MTRREALAGVLGALLLSSCGVVKNYPEFHYRLTVEVDTPEGLRTGSSVIAVKPGQMDFSLGGQDARASGEAVSVDLGGRGVLFALLRSDESADWAGWVMLRLAPEAPYVEGGNQFAKTVELTLANKSLMVLPRDFPRPLPGAKRADDTSDTLPPPTAYPMLVRFTNMADPKTVEKVDPDNLAASFGKGIALRRITVQLTDDPVTTGIEKRLGWLGHYPEPALNPDHSPNDWSASATITHGDFRRQVK